MPCLHLSTHPYVHQLIHPSIAGGVSRDHKSAKRIELSQLGQDLFDFYQFDMIPLMHTPPIPRESQQMINLQTE